MRHSLGPMFAIVLLVAAPRPAGALELHHGPELQGGLGHYTLGDEWAGAFDARWKWEGGVGWFAEVAGPAGLRLGSGLSYRRVADELRSHVTVTSGPETWEFDYRSELALDEIAWPLRVEHAVPGLPMLGIELGAQAEYVLRAVQDNGADPDPAPTIAVRRGVPAAQVFEDVGTFGGASTSSPSRRGASGRRRARAWPGARGCSRATQRWSRATSGG